MTLTNSQEELPYDFSISQEETQAREPQTKEIKLLLCNTKELNGAYKPIPENTFKRLQHCDTHWDLRKWSELYRWLLWPHPSFTTTERKTILKNVLLPQARGESTASLTVGMKAYFQPVWSEIEVTHKAKEMLNKLDSNNPVLLADLNYQIIRITKARQLLTSYNRKDNNDSPLNGESAIME